MITTEADLRAALDAARAAGVVALDTEFVWERTYYPRLGLVQMGWRRDEVVLVDPTVGLDLAPLGDLVSDPDVEIVLHDAVQDLVILRRATGMHPRRVFDTRLAAGFAGYPATLSLADLLREIAGVDLPKTQTRTDWLRRPLKPQQEAYALDDVRHLPAVRDELLRRVADRGRADWLAEDLAALDDPALYDDPDPRGQFRRIRGSGRLSPAEQAVLREVAAWREEAARREDMPRKHVIGDGALLRIARAAPETEADLARIDGVSPKRLRRSARDILDGVRRGRATPPAEQPVDPEPSADPAARKAAVDEAMETVSRCAEASEMDPALVATRADLKEAARDVAEGREPSGRLFTGWRRAVAGEAVERDLRKAFDTDMP